MGGDGFNARANEPPHGVDQASNVAAPPSHHPSVVSSPVLGGGRPPVEEEGATGALVGGGGATAGEGEDSSAEEMRGGLLSSNLEQARRWAAAASAPLVLASSAPLLASSAQRWTHPYSRVGQLPQLPTEQNLSAHDFFQAVGASILRYEASGGGISAFVARERRRAKKEVVVGQPVDLTGLV
jgi:hypothetical protein